MKKLFLSASYITILVMVINFFFKIYLSYEVDKKDLGLFYTFMDVVGIILMIFSGFKDSLIKAYDDNIFNKVFSYYTISFFSVILISILITSTFYNSLNLKEPLFYFILMLLANGVAIFISYINASHKNYKIMLFESLVTAVGLIVSYLILRNFLNGFNLLFFSFLGSFLFRIFYLLVFKNYNLNFKLLSFDSEVKLFFKNSILASLMYFFSGLFISLASVVLLKLFKDSNVLGDFQVVVRSVFFSLVAVFVFPLNTYLFPEISKLISNKEFAELERIEKKFIKYLVIFFVLLLILTFFTKFIISLIFPPIYQDSYKMLNLMLPFLPFIAYTTFALNFLRGSNRFDLALIVRITGSLVFFVSIYIFYLLGFKADIIVISFDLAFLSMAVLAYYFKRRIV